MKWEKKTSRKPLADLLIAFRPGLSGEHENDFSLIVDFIKETIISNSVAPCIRLISFELPDILAEIGLLFELRINVAVEFCDRFI